MRSWRRSQVLGLVLAVLAAVVTVGLVRGGTAPAARLPAIELREGPASSRPTAGPTTPRPAPPPAVREPAPAPTRAPARIVPPAPVPAGPLGDDADDGQMGDDAADGADHDADDGGD